MAKSIPAVRLTVWFREIFMAVEALVRVTERYTELRFREIRKQRQERWRGALVMRVAIIDSNGFPRIKVERSGIAQGLFRTRTLVLTPRSGLLWE
ncbi:uncharacterized protein An02g11850 [Aspergillus niger]|uniref:Contig An02c0380, genomic contig n=2 Tax=Aspergillus niger TaxID=5061 RepID=A2QEQ2_ASPNC|nr:uncharacterized protein An02g11850 [Aspergillus niger]CAK96414.1 unnamed protein product [Aspergillus niger]